MTPLFNRRRAVRDASEAAAETAASLSDDPARQASNARRDRAYRIANLLAGLILVAMAIAVWRDPGLPIRADFAKQRMLLGASSETVEAGDHRWVYAELKADRPDAKTVVLVHGFTGSKENWYRVARQLKGRYRVVMPDLAGWGQSERKDGGDYGYMMQSARLAEFIAKISDKPVALIGHSMGGGIAAATAARAPDRISHVGLVDAAGVRFDDNQFGLDVLAGKNPFAVEDPASLERYLATVFHNRDARPWIPWLADRLYIAQRRRDAAFEQSVLEKIGRSDERFLPGDAAADIAQPALLLWCAQDKVIDVSAMHLYGKRMKHATQALLEDCGHMSLMERPGETAAAIEMLIERGRKR